MWPLSVQCRILGGGITEYHEHVVRLVSSGEQHDLSEAALLAHIKAVYAETCADTAARASGEVAYPRA